MSSHCSPPFFRPVLGIAKALKLRSRLYLLPIDGPITALSVLHCVAWQYIVRTSNKMAGKMSKRKFIHFRVTADQHKAIADSAQEKGQTITQYILRALLPASETTKDD